MKTSLSLVTLSLVLSTSAFARIVKEKNRLFIETNTSKSPITMVNDLVKNKTISKLKMYDNGKVHLLSFAKHNGPTKLYSVDEKGYIYSIEPFSNYEVSSVNDGKFQFKEVPNRRYIVDAKGYFLY